MEVKELTTDQLEGELLMVEEARRRLAAIEVALVAEADRRQVPLSDGCRTTTEWLSARLDIDHSEAAAVVRLAERSSQIPHTLKTLANGKVSVARAELVSRVATQTDEQEWLWRLAPHSLHAAQRLVTRHRPYGKAQERKDHESSFAVIQPSLDESWWSMRAGLAGLAGKVVAEALQKRAEELGSGTGSMPYRQAVALEEFCVGEQGPSFELTGFFDIDATSPDEAAAEVAWGPRVGPDALGEFLCSGSVRLVGTDNAQPVVTSDGTRQIPPAVRAHVMRRDGGCRGDGCTSTRRLQPHHIVPRSHGGTNHPSNLITLCWFHHHVVVHRRGMVIEKQPDGSIRFVVPANSRAPP